MLQVLLAEGRSRTDECRERQRAPLAAAGQVALLITIRASQLKMLKPPSTR